MSTLTQRSFAGGEISPSLYARVDTVKYQTGLRTCYNWIVKKHGGVCNRPGTKFIGATRYGHGTGTTSNVRLIPFDFGEDVIYVLEFGEKYMRVIYSGAYTTDMTRAISWTKKGEYPQIKTVVAHGLKVGQEIAISDVATMTQLNGRNFLVKQLLSTTLFTISELNGFYLDGATTWTNGTGGSLSRIFTNTQQPFTASQLPDVRYQQSADVITFTHPDMPIWQLKRIKEQGSNSFRWVWEKYAGGDPIVAASLVFASDISAPPYSSATEDSTKIEYAITAVDANNGEEGYPVYYEAVGQITEDNDRICLNQSSTGGLLNLDGVGVWAGTYHSNHALNHHGWAGVYLLVENGGNDSGKEIKIAGLDYNNKTINEYVVLPNKGVVLTTMAFWEVNGIRVYDALAGNIHVGVHSAQMYPIKLEWLAGSANCKEFRFYKKQYGAWGYIGRAPMPEHTSVGYPGEFTDNDVTPDILQGFILPPPVEATFASKYNYPTCLCIYQQRMMYAGSLDNPETIWLSQLGRYHNFTQHWPLLEDDHFSFRLAGTEVHRIMHIVPSGKLWVFTTEGEWTIDGNENGSVTPTQINANLRSHYGANRLRPLVIGYNILFVQKRGGTVQNIGYELDVSGAMTYKGTDMTVFAGHLFEGHSISDWTYQQVPDSIIWAVRDDGTLLGMTYLPEHQIFGWHRHEFDGGTVENILAMQGKTTDYLYVVVKREINGFDQKYVELFQTRYPADEYNHWFVDSGLRYSGAVTTAGTYVTIWSYITDGYKHGGLVYVFRHAGSWAADIVGETIKAIDENGDSATIVVTARVSDTILTGNPVVEIPEGVREKEIYTYGTAVDTVGGLWHLEGESVSVIADGDVIASPNNPKYDTVVVSQGTVSLPDKYLRVLVGLPIVQDLETLDYDTPTGESVIGQKKLVSRINVQVEATRGLLAGCTVPTGDDLTEGLAEAKILTQDDIAGAPEALTGIMDIRIQSKWTSTGRVFLRQIDPLPATVLSISPSALVPFKGYRNE